MAAMASPRTLSTGVGPSGPALAQADPRPQPLSVAATQDSPPVRELIAAWRAYCGDFGDDTPRLAAQPGVPDLNVASNRIKPIVNTGVDFLMGNPLTVKVTDRVANEDANKPGKKTVVRVSKAAQQAQALLDATWGNDDQRMTLFSKLGITGGVYGHCFLKVIAPRRGSPSAENPPRLVLLNPETLMIETDPEDADLVARFTIEYAAQGGADGKLPLRKRQTITRLDPLDDDSSTAGAVGLAEGFDADTTWQIQNWIATGATGGRFVADGPPIDWPYPLPPIVDWQNYPNPTGHWGQRDASEALVALNAQLRLVESNINKIGFLQGHPFLYATGADTGGLKPTPGQIMDLGAPDAKLASVNAAGDLNQLMAFAEQLRSDMDEESGVPGVATGRMQDLPRGQVSGVTIRLLYAPLLARNEHKRRLYGQGIRQLCQTIWLLCGMDVATVANLDIQLGWQDPLPTDDLAEAQTAVALSSIGYSQHTLIERTGGDPDTEAQWKADEQQQQADAAAHGQALPAIPGMFGQQQQQQPPQGQEGAQGDEQQGQQGGLGSAVAGKSAPPVNHPAAVAARARMKAATQAAKGR